MCSSQEDVRYKSYELYSPVELIPVEALVPCVALDVVVDVNAMDSEKGN